MKKAGEITRKSDGGPRAALCRAESSTSPQPVHRNKERFFTVARSEVVPSRQKSKRTGVSAGIFNFDESRRNGDRLVLSVVARLRI